MSEHAFRRASMLLLPLVMLPAALFAWSASDDRFRYPRPPTTNYRLVIASPQWEGIRAEFEEGFRRWLYEREGAGVEVVWLEQGGGSKSLRWIEEQFGDVESPRASIGVDVLFGGGTDPYEALKAKGLLERFDPPPELIAPERIPPDIAGFPLYDPDHYWFGTCLTGFGIVVNHRVLETLASRFGDLRIENWNDLADPRLSGWVGSSDPRSSSSYHTYFEIILQQPEGFEAGMRLLREIGGNVSSYTKFSSDIPKMCAVGQFAVAPTIDQYALAQIEKLAEFVPADEPALEFILPQGRTLVNADGAGILRGAPNRYAAERFMEFILSDAAGYLWMLKRGGRCGEARGPRRHGLNRATVLPAIFDRIAQETPHSSVVAQNPFRMRFDFHYDYELARRRWALVNDLLGALLIDTREELAAAIAAWRRLDGDAKREAETILFSLPFTASDLDGRLLEDWNDSVKRERLKIEWTEFARARYRMVAAQAERSR